MPGTRTSNKTKKSYKESDDESEDQVDDSESEDEGLAKKSKKIKKTAKKDTKKKDDKKKKPAPKKGKKKKDESDEEDDDAEDEEEDDNPLMKKGKKGGDAGKQKGYTADQFEKYQELLEKLNKHTANELKEMLKKNDQSMTGAKDDLIQRVADGKVLGKIPRCPKCSGGRPKFDYKTGMYKCPGFRDDEEFRFCNKKYSMEELPREDWTD
jgi:hypothetical protein